MGLRHRSKPHPAKDLTPGPPQNFVADAVSSTVFALSWQEDPNKTLPDDFDLDFSLVSNSGPWTPIPINKVYTYNHTGQDVTVRHWWRLVAKHAGFASTSVIVTAIAYRPVFTVAPPTHLSPASGDTFQFTATDVDGGVLIYSLAFKYRSDISIDPLTGLVTVPATAAGTNGNIIVRCTDPIGLYAETTCAVQVNSVVPIFARFLIPAIPGNTIRAYSGGNYPLRTGGFGTPVAGDIIELQAGTHSPLKFTGLQGTFANHITIRGPQTGIVPASIRRKVTGSGEFILHLVNCHHVTINGENPSIGTQGSKGWKCGIQVMYAESGIDGPTDYIKYSATNGSSSPTLCHHITLRFVEVTANWPTNPNTGGSGYGIRPHHVEINRSAAPYIGYYVEGLVIEYCYFHNLRAAVMYVGGNWIETTTNGNYYPAPLRGIVLRHNWLENAGGGIHCKMWWKDGEDGTRNAVHDNYIKNCGQHHNSPHTAESIGTLSCTVDIYNNKVLDNAWPNAEAHDPARPNPNAFRINTNDGPLAGVAVSGYGVIPSFQLNVWNNLVTRAGMSLPSPVGSGITVSKETGTVGYEAHIYNNTVYDNAEYGITVSNVEAGSFIKNNISVLNATQISPASTTSTITVSNNVTTGGSGLFVNSTQGIDNFRLNAPSSPAASGTAGVDYSLSDIGTPPHGTNYTLRGVNADNPDCGAYEE